MSYVDPDYKTKKAFKEAVTAGIEHRTYSYAGVFPTKQDGHDVIEGPHYPKAHAWYAEVEVSDGVVIKVVA
ncbi:hypothetical protein LCGC14_2180190 [marine sediment metagenome]|uniref:Uncharacterized protein n=1 Tax=marine sediment metagenome TaxID=412755 RepID=A0A0F9GIF4_9ZZZZ